MNDDYDSNKPEEAGSTAEDFIHTKEDSDIEDMKLQDDRYQEAKKTCKCPICGGKVEIYEVTSSRNPDDMEADGERAYCKNKKCGWKVELDW
jgi:DNA-directed RNA polymerase subunit M/transcription elongation factor TFIIS